MTRSRVATYALCLLVLGWSLAPGPAAANDEPLTGMPFRGALPEPEGAIHDPDVEQGSYVVRILDGRTGSPIEGAYVRRYPEMIQDHWIRHDLLLAQGRADERGYARISAEGYDGESHWVCDAPGYGPSHDYAVSAPDVVYLFPGVTLTGRLLDPLGRPVAGATVDYFLGCGHGPTMRSARTDERGHFTLGSVNPWDGRLWIEGWGIKADYHDTEQLHCYGDRLHDIVADSGVTADGRVLDAAGNPIQGVVVRSMQCHRGPATMTDVDGYFRLWSVEPDNELYLHHPATLRTWGSSAPSSVDHDRGWREGLLRIYRLDHLRLLPPALAKGRLVVQAEHTVDPGEDQGIGFDLISHADGSVIETYEEEAPVVLDLPLGRYQLVPSAEDRLARFTFDPIEVTVRSGEPTKTRIVYREQPRLVIKGLPERWKRLEVNAPGVSLSNYEDGGTAWSPFVPADGPVAICLRVTHEAPPRCFRAGPLEDDNTRRIEIELPKPTRIELAGPESGYDGVELYPRGTSPLRHLLQDLEKDPEAVARGDERVFLTYAAGPLELHVQSGTKLYRLPVELPHDGGTTVRVDPTTAPFEQVFEQASDYPPELAAVLDVRDAAGRTPTDAVLIVADRRWSRDVELVSRAYERGIHMRPWLWGRIERPGWRTLHLRPTKPGPLDLRWGSSTLDLRLEYDGESFDTPTAVWVDDTVYAALEGRLHLRGLEPGTHDVIVVPHDPTVTPRDDDQPIEAVGRRLRITLEANATRTVRVDPWPDE